MRHHQTEVGLELRCRYSEHVDHFFQSQFAIEIGAGRAIAQEWKQATIAKGS